VYRSSRLEDARSTLSTISLKALLRVLPVEGSLSLPRGATVPWRSPAPFQVVGRSSVPWIFTSQDRLQRPPRLPDRSGKMWRPSDVPRPEPRFVGHRRFRRRQVCFTQTPWRTQALNQPLAHFFQKRRCRQRIPTGEVKYWVQAQRQKGAQNRSSARPSRRGPWLISWIRPGKECPTLPQWTSILGPVPCERVTEQTAHDPREPCAPTQRA